MLVIKNISFTTGSAGEAPYIDITSNVVHLFGFAQIPGQIYAGEYAYLNGSFEVFGIAVAGQLDVEGTLRTTNYSIIVAGDVDIRGMISSANTVVISTNPYSNFSHVKVHDHSLVFAPYLSLGENVSMEVHDSEIHTNLYVSNTSTLEPHNSTFFGTVFSDGLVRINRNRTLFVVGNYTQSSQGSLELRDLDLVNRTGGYVNATGPVQLSGKLVYSLLTDRSDHEIQMLVVLAPGGVTGTFAQSTSTGSIQKVSELEYSDHSVSLLFNKTEGESKASLWWIWLIVAFAVIAIIALIVLLYATRHRRKGFRELPMK